MKRWVMDYETLINCFVAVFTEYKTSETKIFVVHELKNQYDELLSFLNDNKLNEEYHISYNGLNFDSQITEFLLRDGEELSGLDPETIAHSIYLKAQRTIELSNAGEFPEYPERALQIPQLDIFRLNHWDNPAKRSSLKWIEFSMDWNNVRDMPIHHSTYVKSYDEIDTITKYCVNDVAATKQIMNLRKEQIMLRKALSEEYNINLLSAS